MKIQEVMNTTGLSKKALQYYEDKCLIQVKKDSNGYRAYDEDCVHRLWQIKVLRNMDFSIQEIHKILNEKDCKEIFQVHFNAIDQKLSQCMIQKDYLKKLYEGYQRDIQLEILQEMDEEMQEDFKRSEEFFIDIDKKHIPYSHIVFIILTISIGVINLINYHNAQSRLWGFLLTFCGVYTLVAMMTKKELEKPISPLRLMMDDGVRKLLAWIERIHKK